MKAKRRIFLYGNSVILGTIGASLRRYPQFEVTTLASLPREPQQVDNVKPDIVLFDLEAPHTEAVFSLLKADPTVLLIGISPDINLVDVWSGQQLRELTTQGLIKLIKSAVDNLPVDSGIIEGRLQ